MKKLSEIVIIDKWKELRRDMNLFRAVEPSVELIAITQPLQRLKELGVTSETLPAYTARHCWESSGQYTEDPEHNHELDLRLTRNLIKRGHDTPLQALEFTFDVLNTSKSVQAQWTRHKIGVGWSYRSTRFVEASGNNFVYNAYDYINDEKKVKELLRIDEDVNMNAVNMYEEKRNLGATKQDSRKVMPVQFATNCSFFSNARALRHLYNLRIDKHAEWEIRRMSAMLLDEVMQFTPAIFEDIHEKFLDKYSK